MIRPNLKTAAERFRWAREQKKLSQAALGALLGLSQGAIEKYENGKTRSLKKLADAARLLNQPYEWLAYGEARYDDSAGRPATQGALNEEQQEFLNIMRKVDDPELMRKLKDQLLSEMLKKSKSDRTD